MRILVYCPVFYPSLGGLEINVAQLATGFREAGHEVVVVARTENPGPEPFAFRVVRRPSRGELLQLVRWCQVFFQANVSLRGLWPLLLVRRPWVVSHQGWYNRPDGSLAPQDRLKRFLLRWGRSISDSQAVAEHLHTPSVVIPNAYRDDLFRRLPDVPRTEDLIFVGRLVSDKGMDTLLEALGLLAMRGLDVRLTVVGDGPERPALEAQARALGSTGRVRFLGARHGEEIVRLLNGHRILVVPSRYDEPFGIVALEGIACGCLVVGSRGGGLKEAIGRCGLTFRNGDPRELADLLAAALANPDRFAPSHEDVAGHLARHQGQQMVNAYLQVFDEALARGREAGS
ncbi:MAG TPA: glycosyltransferase family 4 protein [Thermoanaerobaculia bacterium]|jgi:glycosyltransferase involved in cell wall biosynthesis|nr:glycosyltransferase family 4 protein [Thermoanaerobaculia bacterium]